MARFIASAIRCPKFQIEHASSERLDTANLRRHLEKSDTVRGETPESFVYQLFLSRDESLKDRTSSATASPWRSIPANSMGIPNACQAARTFAEIIKDTSPEEIADMENAPLRKLLGKIRLQPMKPDFGKPYLRATTSLQALALLEIKPGSDKSEPGYSIEPLRRSRLRRR